MTGERLRQAAPGLYPTKTRLALLRAADEGRLAFDTHDGTATEDVGTVGCTATARYREASAAGWVTLGPEIAKRSRIYRVDLTDAGRVVLAAAGLNGQEQHHA